MNQLIDQLFDDYEVETDENVWSQICDPCSKKTTLPPHHLDVNMGFGACGIKGCWSDADHYIDFK
jgi:hypothetical protein